MLYGHKEYGEGTKYACEYCGDESDTVQEIHSVFCCSRCAEPVTPETELRGGSSMGSPAFADQEDEAINMQRRIRRES